MQMLTNETLSADGFLLHPDFRRTLLPEPYGTELCTPEHLAYSPAPRIFDEIYDVPQFSDGPDIALAELILKTNNSNHVLVPKELEGFMPLIAACVAYDFVCDPDTHRREFALTITRRDVAAGEPHRTVSHAKGLHVHLPAPRLNQAYKIPVTRTYTYADNFGTEYYVGPRCPTQTIPKSTIQAVPNRRLAVFTTPTLHRTHTFTEADRRTVFLLSSYSVNGGIQGAFNPMIERLVKASYSAAQPDLLRAWRHNTAELTRRQGALIPTLPGSGVAPRGAPFPFI